MAQLTPEQQQVLTRILQIGRQKGATPKQIKAAIETGLVESNLRNLSGGDADSSGWRQERASLYSNPTDLNASISRFFQETAAVKDKYGKAGDLAAAVQRPAAQYRGRYQQRAGDAVSLMGGAGQNGSAGARDSSTTTTTKTIPGVDNSGQRQALVAAYLANTHNPDALTALAAGLLGAKDTAATTSTSTRTTKTGGKKTAKGLGPLLELFYQGQGGIDVKNGQRQPLGFVSGHTDHVHVASGPKTVVELGQLAQQMGLHVGENPHFGGVEPVHTKTSYHYRGQAIDVSGAPEKMRAYARRVASLYHIK